MLHKTNLNSIANATNYQKNDPYNLDALKERLKNNDAEALRVFELAGVSSELIAEYTPGKITRKTACPICGGTDRFHLKTAQDGRGVVAFCSDKDEKHRGNGRPVNIKPFDFFQAARGLDLNAAVCEIVKELDGPQRMPMRRNDVVIQAAPPIMAKPSARITATTAGEKSKKGLRVVPESEAKQETRDYIYWDETGAPVFNARRVDFYDKTTGERVAIVRNGTVKEKDFKTYIPDGAGGWKTSKGLDRSTIPPYNAPELKAPKCERAFIVEGEKCAEKLRPALVDMQGEAVATTTGAATNAGHWTKWAPCYLAEKLVFIPADNDAPGRKAAEVIAEAATAANACGVFLVDFSTRPDGTPAPEGYDVADYLDDLAIMAPELVPLEQIIARAVPFTPSALSPLQREKEAGNGLDAPPVDPDEELNRAAKLARIEREQELEEQATKRDLALYTDPFPEGLLPLSIDKLATSYANKYHLPKASIVFTQLATVGAFLGTKFSFYTPELWEEPCYAKIGLLGVAPSGSYKSPIFKLCTRPLKEITAQFATEYQAKLKAAKQKRNEIKCIKGNIKQLEGFIKTRRGDKTAETIAEIKDFRTRIKELERRLDSIDIEETFDPPEPPKFLISGTPEGVLKRVAYNTKNGYTNGAVMGTDEGLRVLSLSGGVDKALEKFFKYTEVLDGTTADNETSTTESTGDYNIPGEKFTGTLFFIQPGPFARCLRKKELVEQGFLNRFIKVYIPYIEENESREPVRNYDSYKQIFDECLAAPPQQFTLSPQALNVAYNWKDKIKQEQNKAHRRNDEVSAAFLGKLQILFISFVTSIHYCDAIDRKEGAYRQCGEFVTPTDIIDVETVERAIKLVEAAAEYTQACNRYLDECIEEAEAPKKQRKENAVENRVLEIISNAGRQGATIKTLQEKINFLRGKVGKRRAEKILEIFRNAGEIEKHSARYYVATLPESLDDQEGGAE